MKIKNIILGLTKRERIILGVAIVIAMALSISIPLIVSANNTEEPTKEAPVKLEVVITDTTPETTVAEIETEPETEAVTTEAPVPETTVEETEPETEPKTEPIIEETVEEVEEPITYEETEEPKPYYADVYTNEAEMLARVIYQEAGGEQYSDLTRMRVADVVLNRIADPRFPNTMYEVLTAPCQYGMYSVTGIIWPERASNPNEAASVANCYQIATAVLNGSHSDLYGNGYVFQAEFEQGYDIIYADGTYFGK